MEIERPEIDWHSLCGNISAAVGLFAVQESMVAASGPMASVKVYSEPNAKSKLVGSLKRAEEAIATGEEKDGFVQIDGENVSGGWVQRTLVSTATAPN